MRTRMSLREAIRFYSRDPLTQSSGERPGVAFDRALELAGSRLAQVAGLANVLENIAVLRAHQREEPVLEVAHPADAERVEIAVDAGIDHHDLLFHLERRELRLLEQLGQARAAVEQALRGGVEVRTELRERRHLAVLRELALDAAGDLLHRLGLRGGADARHREAD